MDKTAIIAVDPGRDKSGVAVVCPDRSNLQIEIVLTDKIVETVNEWYCKYRNQGVKITAIILGDGTFSKEFQRVLKPVADDFDINLEIVDEYNTTAEGRLRYWRCNKPRGLKSLMPISWLTPPVPVDDYTAWIIGERYFEGKT